MQSVYHGLKSCSESVFNVVQVFREKCLAFDVAYVSTLRLINGVSHRIFGCRLFFDLNHLKTHRERKWQKEFIDLKKQLQEKEGVNEFCHETATCIESIALKNIGELLRELPQKVENIIFYWFGWISQYGYRQFTKRGGRDTALNTKIVSEIIKPKFYGLTTLFTHTVCRPVLQSLINPEILLLKLFQKILSSANASSTKSPLFLKNALFNRLAKSLAQQDEIEKIWALPKPEKERRIEVLDFLKKENDLPSSLPDPDGLFPENIDEKEAECLRIYFQKHIEDFLDRHAPDEITTWRNFTGLLYQLEGKEAFVQLAADILIQTVINQIADPNLFAQTILYSKQEVMDLELDGYGIDKGEKIYNTGIEILKSIKNRASSVHILHKTGLRRSPGGQEGNRQKEATKEQLKEYFSEIFLHMIRNEKKTSKMDTSKSIYGGGSIGYQYVLEAIDFGFQNYNQLVSTLAKMAEKQFSSYLAERMVALIYHPSWKIVLLQLLDELSKPIRDTTIEKDEFLTVANFLAKHFFPEIDLFNITNSSLSSLFGNFIKIDLSSITTSTYFYIKQDSLFQEFKIKFHQPNGLPNIGEKLQAMIPGIQEYHLYNRLTDLIRKKGHSFEGDSKFWEVFLRCYLADHVPNTGQNDQEKLRTRTKILVQLLEMEDSELIEELCKVYKPKIKKLENAILKNISQLSKTEYIPH